MQPPSRFRTAAARYFTSLPRGARQHFPTALQHQAQRDNLSDIDRSPGRVTRRPHHGMAVPPPQVSELATP